MLIEQVKEVLIQLHEKPWFWWWGHQNLGVLPLRPTNLLRTIVARLIKALFQCSVSERISAPSHAVIETFMRGYSSAYMKLKTICTKVWCNSLYLQHNDATLHYVWWHGVIFGSSSNHIFNPCSKTPRWTS